MEAQPMNITLSLCVVASKLGHHVRVSNLEDRVDYVNSQFQPSIMDLKVFGVKVTPSTKVSRRYRLRKVTSVGNRRKTVSCHKAAFPFSVFMCHHLEGQAYHVKLQSLDKDDVEFKELVSCHYDTIDWNPRYGAFEILNLVLGQTMCHFFHGDCVIFKKPS